LKLQTIDISIESDPIDFIDLQILKTPDRYSGLRQYDKSYASGIKVALPHEINHLSPLIAP
jgi:hypothetical protein